MKQRMTASTVAPWVAPLVRAGSVAAFLAGSFGLVHCSGDNATIQTDGGRRGEDSSTLTAGDDGSAPMTGGDDNMEPTGDGGPNSTAGDGATDQTGPDGSNTIPPPIPVPEGGAPSDPGSVPCNGAPCAVNMGYSCCVTSVDGGAKEVCNPPNTGCSGAKRECNEASDCNGGVCCETIVGIAAVGPTACSSTGACPAGTTFQACRVDSECGQTTDAGALKRCVPQLCTNPQNMHMVSTEACAVPASAGNPGPALAFCAASN
jgi:hypothetical protein